VGDEALRGIDRRVGGGSAVRHPDRRAALTARVALGAGALDRRVDLVDEELARRRAVAGLRACRSAATAPAVAGAGEEDRARKDEREPHEHPEAAHLPPPSAASGGPASFNGMNTPQVPLCTFWSVVVTNMSTEFWMFGGK